MLQLSYSTRYYGHSKFAVVPQLLPSPPQSGPETFFRNENFQELQLRNKVYERRRERPKAVHRASPRLLWSQNGYLRPSPVTRSLLRLQNTHTTHVTCPTTRRPCAEAGENECAARIFSVAGWRRWGQGGDEGVSRGELRGERWGAITEVL